MRRMPIRHASGSSILLGIRVKQSLNGDVLAARVRAKLATVTKRRVTLTARDVGYKLADQALIILDSAPSNEGLRLSSASSRAAAPCKMKSCAHGLDRIDAPDFGVNGLSKEAPLDLCGAFEAAGTYARRPSSSDLLTVNTIRAHG
jgi:shikimate kinase